MIVEWSDQAIEDLDGAASWIERRNPRAARELIDAIGDTVTSLAAREFEGREVVIDDGRAVRRWPAGSLVIYYRRRGDVLELLRVFDARREPIER